MNILIVCKGTLPPATYGGTERVVWSLIKGLYQLGHKVYILNPLSVKCEWANCIIQQPDLSIDDQIPDEIDIVHFHIGGSCNKKPYVITRHGNNTVTQKNDPNSIFVSHKHALNHGCESFVYNGLDWDDYRQPNLNANKRDNRYHFLGKAAWRLKNVQGAIDITKNAKVGLDVLGGHRLNFKMGFRLTLDRHVKFHGMVDNIKKCNVLERSKGLIFPVTWEEPFGLAITESLFMGTPVFATPYGSLPELISTPEFGLLSNIEADLVDAIKHRDYDPRLCYEYARDTFDHISMTKAYLNKYEQVLQGELLNSSISAPIQKMKKLPYYQ